MKQKILILSLLLMVSFHFTSKAQNKAMSVSNTFAELEQGPTPAIRWSYSAVKTGSMEATLTISVAINKGWRVYALSGNKEGPVNTSFTFQLSPDYELVDSLIVPQPVILDDKFFLFKVKCYQDSAVFKQKIKLHKDQAIVKGNIKYMGAAANLCLPVKDVSFSMPVR